MVLMVLAVVNIITKMLYKMGMLIDGSRNITLRKCKDPGEM
jgi:hypothetical protein